MKVKTFSILTAFLLILATLEVSGQNIKELRKLRKENNNQEACNALQERENEENKRKLMNQQGQHIQSASNEEVMILEVGTGVIEKAAEKGSIAAQDLLKVGSNSKASEEYVNNNQFEKGKSLAESLELDTDYYTVKENDQIVIKLKSYHGFEIYTDGLISSIEQFNNNLDEYNKARKAYNQAQWNCANTKDKQKQQLYKGTMDAKSADMEKYQKLAEQGRDAAKKYAGTIKRSTEDGRFNGKLEEILNTLNDGFNNTLNLSEQSTKVANYETLKDLFKDCTDCGK